VQLSFRQKEQLFHELAQLARSGLPLSTSLEMLGRNSFSRMGRCAASLRRALQSEGTASKAFRETGFEPSDIAVIQAGEMAGAIEPIFTELSAYYAELAKARTTIVDASLYPLVVMHLGVLLLAIPKAIMGDGWKTYASTVLPTLLGFYAVVIVVIFLWKFTASSYGSSRPVAEILARVPLLGYFLTMWTGWRFAAILSLYVKAGGGISRGLETAGSSCGSSLLAAATCQAGQQLQSGRSLGVILRCKGGVPEALERAAEVGTHAGRLDEELPRAAQILRDRTMKFLVSFTFWMPKILYIVIVLYMGYQCVVTMQGVYKGVDQALDLGS